VLEILLLQKYINNFVNNSKWQKLTLPIEKSKRIKLIKFNSHHIFLPFLGTALQRFWNGGRTEAERRQSTQNAIFFLELNAKHIHTPQNEGITIRISGSFRVCICLPNIYTTPTHHIHSSMHIYEILCSFTLVWEIYHVWRPVYMLCICLANIYTLLTYWTSV
jgi:hypothetical protein